MEQVIVYFGTYILFTGTFACAYLLVLQVPEDTMKKIMKLIGLE